MTSFELLSSTRYDEYLLNLRWNNDNGIPSPFLLLPYHYNRLVDAAEQHGWDQATSSLSIESIKSACLKAISESSETDFKAFKIRLTLSQSGVLTVSASPANPFTSDPTSASFFNPNDNPSLFGPVLTIHVDSQPTSSSIFTTTKTTYRQHYDEARSRVGVPPLSSRSAAPHLGISDVLLYNPENLLTETSICNIAFYRSRHWVTPPLSTGCLPGVLRRWLLEQGRIREAKESILTKESITEGDWILLFNAVQGCRLGRIIAN